MHHIERVDLSLVAGEGVHESHVRVIPDFDRLVPGSSDAEGGLLLVIELDARDGVSVLVLVNDVLALATGVPDSDGFVQTSRDDLSVVRRERDREDVFGVSGKAVHRGASCDVPESAGAIP